MSESHTPSFDESLNGIFDHFSELMTQDGPRNPSSRPSGAATLLHLICKEVQTASTKKVPVPCSKQSKKSESFPKFPAEPSYPAPIIPCINLLRQRSHGSFRIPPQIPLRRQRARSIAPTSNPLVNRYRPATTPAVGESPETTRFGYTRSSCHVQQDEIPNEEVYMEWAERAVENSIRGVEELVNEPRCRKTVVFKNSTDTSTDPRVGNIHRPNVGAQRPLTPPQYNKGDLGMHSPSSHDHQEYSPPLRHMRSQSSVVPKLRPRTRGPSVTCLVNNYNNLATTGSRSAITKSKVVETVIEEVEAPSEDKDGNTSEDGDPEEEPLALSLSLIDEYLQKLMDNPTVNYFKRMFKEDDKLVEEEKPEEKDVLKEEVKVLSPPEHPAVGLARQEMSYIKDNFSNYLEAQPPTLEELTSLRKFTS